MNFLSKLSVCRTQCCSRTLFHPARVVIGCKRWFTALDKQMEDQETIGAQRSHIHNILHVPINVKGDIYINSNNYDTTLEYNSEEYLSQRLHAPFHKWCKERNISLFDGLMLYRLQQNALAGRNPDFPRIHPLYKEMENHEYSDSFEYLTKYYWNSIDTDCFVWLQKQRILYRNNRINPWIQWKLEQFNVTLEWTREPLVDRMFSWIGHCRNGIDEPECNAESDALFPFYNESNKNLKFLNPFYEAWYDSMPSTLKALRLMNSARDPRDKSYLNKENSIKSINYRKYFSKENEQEDMENELSDTTPWYENDEIRSKYLVKTFDWKAKKWRISIGNKNIRELTDDEKESITSLENEFNDNKDLDNNSMIYDDFLKHDENVEKMKKRERAKLASQLRKSKLNQLKAAAQGSDNDDGDTSSAAAVTQSHDVHDATAIEQTNEDDDNEIAQANEDGTSWISTEKQSFRANFEYMKENKAKFFNCGKHNNKPLYSIDDRAKFYIEALKHEKIKPCNLTVSELKLVCKGLGLNHHWKWPRSRRWYREPDKMEDSIATYLKPPKFEAKTAPYPDDVKGIYNRLDVYYKTKHPGQPPWGVWDINEPILDAQYLQLRIESWLKQFYQTPKGKQFINKNLKRKLGNNNTLKKRFLDGIKLLEMEHQKISHELAVKNHEIEYLLQARDDRLTQYQDAIKDVKKLEKNLQRIDQIIDNVYQRNDLNDSS